MFVLDQTVFSVLCCIATFGIGWAISRERELNRLEADKWRVRHTYTAQIERLKNELEKTLGLYRDSKRYAGTLKHRLRELRRTAAITGATPIRWPRMSYGTMPSGAKMFEVPAGAKCWKCSAIATQRLGDSFYCGECATVHG